jgi:hypothetical protein
MITMSPRHYNFIWKVCFREIERIIGVSRYSKQLKFNIKAIAPITIHLQDIKSLRAH